MATARLECMPSSMLAASNWHCNVRPRTTTALLIMALPSACSQLDAHGCCDQVSAGFDAHWRDPLASLQFRSSTYHRLASGISSLAQSLCGKPHLSQIWVIISGGWGPYWNAVLQRFHWETALAAWTWAGTHPLF